MVRLGVNGIGDLRAQIEGFRSGHRSNVSREVDLAVEHFIDIAQEVVEVDEGNLRDSIGELARRQTPEGEAVVVGVDLSHTPATRAEVVGDYAGYAHDRVPYIDIALESTQQFMEDRMERTVAARVRRFFGGARRTLGRLLGDR